ncbi:hypothetical protein Taro_034091 [Colocasia esculenta]|uniref:Uncharacterized protein n=1 Tax=Colocasia esculenta TaxID=4460 RepID=A0A843VZR3_COLES|nr:hypothetical protein [Colocasia esculenta]
MVRRSFSDGCSVPLVEALGCSFLISWRSGMLLLPLLLEFLLLWLVRDWLSLLSLVREAHPPTLFRWQAFQQGPSVSCKRVLLLWLGARVASVVVVSLVLRLVSSSACASVWVASFPAGSECELQESVGVVAGDSLSQEFVVRRLWWRFVTPCVASSVSCERECSCTRSELRVAFLQVLEWSFGSAFTGFGVVLMTNVGSLSLDRGFRALCGA